MPRLSLLVEDLLPLLSTASADLELPYLGRLLARCDFTPGALNDPDALRFSLFGLETAEPLPVAALTSLCHRGETAGTPSYCLRADPVTLWADLARVIMTSHGFADLSIQERKEIELTVLQVLEAEGIRFEPGPPDCWILALDQPLEFDFPSLSQSMGMDAAELLPDLPEARPWRRLLNEIQMALHANPVNVRRRKQGRLEINSVWFWGQGRLPAASGKPPFQTVYSDQAVSRGLALVHDINLFGLQAFRSLLAGTKEWPGELCNALVDWTRAGEPAEARLRELEAMATTLLRAVRQHGLVLEIFAGDGSSWKLDRWRARRFWRKAGTRELFKRFPSPE